MKFTSVALAFAAFSAYTSALLDRDLDTIQGVLDKVSSAIISLDEAAKSFSSNTKPVVDKAKGLINTINTGKTTVDRSGDLTLSDALGLVSPVQALTKKAQALADDFKARRSNVEKAKGCSIVRNNLGQINSGSQSLTNSIVSKVPQAAQSIARELASGLTKVLDQAQNDFSPKNCKDSGSSFDSAGDSAPANPISAPATTRASGSSSIPSTWDSKTSSSSSAAAATQTNVVGSSSAPSTWISKNVGPTATSTSTTGNKGTAPTISGPAVTAGAAVMAPASALAMVIAGLLLW
ncbi:hypothetical protein ACHAQJ_006186 [Trichoderma viride]